MACNGCKYGDEECSALILSRPTMPRGPTKPAQLEPDPFDLTTRVFLSYRREDSSTAVQHLRESLGRLIGEDKIFRDVDSIPLGKNFETVIGEAIRGASACLVIIGPNWLAATQGGRSRLDDPEDFVRTEVELALKAGIEVIPVLVDGARMPGEKDLPKSISALANLNAQELPWQSGVAKLSHRIDQIERRRLAKEAALQIERDRLDLTAGRRVQPGTWKRHTDLVSLNVVIRIMELSLSRQGQQVFLSPSDLAESVRKAAGKSVEHGFHWSFVQHVVDFVGVRAKGSEERYVARSYPAPSMERTIEELGLGRPLLAAVQVSWDYWFKQPASKTGFIERTGDGIRRSYVGGVLGWDPAREHLKILMPWPDWGQKGIAMLTRKAAEGSLLWDYCRSVEVVAKPELEGQ
jgi:hypothetical protein